MPTMALYRLCRHLIGLQHEIVGINIHRPFEYLQTRLLALGLPAKQLDHLLGTEIVQGFRLTFIPDGKNTVAMPDVIRLAMPHRQPPKSLQRRMFDALLH